MSDRPIQVGDLVQVVKPTVCCGQLGKSFGVIFKVRDLRYREESFCSYCGCGKRVLLAYGWRRAISFARLKRIPPLDEIESEKRDEKLTEPA